MLAERKTSGRPLWMTPVRAALALVMGLAGLAIGAPAASAVGSDVPVRVVIVAPIVVPAGTTGFIASTALAQYTSETGLLTRQLDAVIDRPVTIAIDPSIIASIRILGNTAPESARLWLDRLENASNEIFALAYADSDLTLATQAGTQGVLAPTSFEFAIDPGLFEPAPDATETPTPAPTPTAPVDPNALPALPTAESLVAWPYSLESIAWPRANTVIGSDLGYLTAAGYTTTILASGNVTRDAGEALVDLGGTRAVVTDDPASAALSAAARAVTPDDWQNSLTTLYASLVSAAAEQDGDQATVVLTLDRSVPGTGNRIADTLSALFASGAVSAVGLGDVIGGQGASATLVDQPQGPEIVATTTRMLLAEQGEQRFASIAERPEFITGQQRLTLLALSSNSWRQNPSGWDAATETFIEDSADLRNSVQLVEKSNLNFFADGASVGVNVTNGLDQAVTVYITADTNNSLLAIEQNGVELTVPPNSQGTGQIPMQAVSNGTVMLTLSLHSVTGEVIGTPTVTKVNVQAGWETPIVLAFAILVVVVFGVGIVRNILRRRRPAETPADD